MSLDSQLEKISYARKSKSPYFSPLVLPQELATHVADPDHHLHLNTLSSSKPCVRGGEIWLSNIIEIELRSQVSFLWCFGSNFLSAETLLHKNLGLNRL